MSHDEPRNHAKMQILKALVDLNDTDLAAMHVWFTSRDFTEDRSVTDMFYTYPSPEDDRSKLLSDLQRLKVYRKAHFIIDHMRESLKQMTPFEAEYPTENITMPQLGEQAENAPENTCHIDEFIYDEEDIENLVEEGKVYRRYCGDCNSRNIKDLTFISHSMSKLAIQYVFKVMLPDDLQEFCVLDVGSRLGAVIFGGYYFSNAASIIGIEMNKEWCDVVNSLIDEYNLNKNRIKVICSDVMACAEKIKKANIIFINVLDYFVNEEKQKQMWHFFKDNIRKGSYIVTNRSAEETFTLLGMYEEFSGWLKMFRPFHTENEIYFDFEDFNYGDLCLYLVL